MLRCKTALAAAAVAIALALPPSASSALAQSDSDTAAPPQPAAPSPEPTIAYKPPLRGAPGGRVGGASRGMIRVAQPLPTLDPIAPLDHTGLTALAAPTLYFFVSTPVSWPTQFTISRPLQPDPVVEVTIPSPTAPGLYAVRLADYRVQLDPGIIYTWSAAVLIDPHDWSHNIVASATIERLATPEPAGGAAALAQAGLWYDAVAAAAALADRHAALGSLLQQVGLTAAATFERGTASPPLTR